MSKGLKILRWILFILAIIFILVAVFAMTIGQKLPYEFDSKSLASVFYLLIFFGLPIAILLTLLGSIRRRRKSVLNISIGLLTVLLSVGTIYYLYLKMVLFGFGTWVNFNIAYENKANPKIKIVDQRYDVGALGIKGMRTVKLTPFLGIFNRVEWIDTTALNKSEWVLINKEGDVHFP